MTGVSDAQRLQETPYEDEDVEVYRQAPHLRHRSVHEMLLSRLAWVLGETERRGLPRTLVEVGAGAGGFVEPCLAYGYEVTATDMARPSVQMLGARYGRNPRFTVLLDPDGDLAVLGAARFSVALYASVLHHIPDYIAAIDATLSHIEPGGAFVSFQDPMWYPSTPRPVRALSDAVYLAWRLSRGDLIAGATARLRRARGSFDESEPRDMVEYHVVRQGVDHDGIARAFRDRFDRFEVIRYWSTQSVLGQKLGESLAAKNTFAVVATGYRG